jgi:excisionase family DNA binding protein
MTVRETRLQDRAKFTTGDLAELLSTSRNTIVRYIEDGRLRARRTVGGWYVVPRQEVLDFLWDLSFSKQTPLRVWRAATLAYDEMSKSPPAPKAQKARKR